MDSIIVLPDMHVPEHDKRTVNNVLKYVQDTGPHKAIIQLGDFVDLSCISSHSKDSLIAQTERTVQGEYAEGRKILKDIQSVSPDSEKIMLEGNHEFRATRWIEKYPQMRGAIEPQLGLDLDKYGWKYIPYWSMGTPYKYKKAMFVHGRWCNKYHAEKHVREYAHNIFYGHCFSDDTEVLTPTGWKLGTTIKQGDTIATWDTEGSIVFDTVQAKYEYDHYKELIHIKGGLTDIMVTPDHGVIETSNQDRPKFIKAKDLEEYAGFRFNLAGQSFPHTLYTASDGNQIMQEHSYCSGIPLSDDMLRLLIWIATDGSFDSAKYVYKDPEQPRRGRPRGPSGIRVHLKKVRKIKALSELLDSLNIEYKKVTTLLQTVKFRFHLPTELTEYFNWPNRCLPVDILKANSAQATIIFDTIAITDGHRVGASLQYSTAKEQEADLVQALAVLHNHRANKLQVRCGTYIVSINMERNSTWLRDSNVSRVPYNGKVWCVTVPSGALLVRRNGKTCITQNTHDVQEFSQARYGDNDTIVGASLGCLCKYDMTYMQGAPSKWQQAFGHFFFKPNGFFNYYVVRVFDHKFVGPNEKEY